MRNPRDGPAPCPDIVWHERVKLRRQVRFELERVFGHADRPVRQRVAIHRPLEDVEDGQLGVAFLRQGEREVESGPRGIREVDRHRMRLNGSFDVARARGGTVSTGQVAFRSTFSVVEPSTRCSKPPAP